MTCVGMGGVVGVGGCFGWVRFCVGEWNCGWVGVICGWALCVVGCCVWLGVVCGWVLCVIGCCV